MTVMTDQEQDEAIRKGGEFGSYVADLTARLIEAETRADSLETVRQLQEAEIERLTKQLSNSERQRKDFARDVQQANDALLKIGIVVRETAAQRMARPELPALTGAPQDPARLKIVRETAIAHAAASV